MQNTITECERVGHEDGLAAGLALALAEFDGPAAPGPVAALPSAAVQPWSEVIQHDMAHAEGISFVRSAARPGTPAEELTALAARLGAVRIGATLRLMEKAVAHLSDRVVDGEPTLAKQLVQGQLADALTATEAARCCLATTELPEAVTDVHDRLTEVDWQLVKLLGASGYVGRNPACGAYVSRLVANCWVPRRSTP
jgi:alkylation response protein AidB-like acyl-CoA dehydrogenase